MNASFGFDFTRTNVPQALPVFPFLHGCGFAALLNDVIRGKVVHLPKIRSPALLSGTEISLETADSKAGPRMTSLMAEVPAWS